MYVQLISGNGKTKLFIFSVQMRSIKRKQVKVDCSIPMGEWLVGYWAFNLPTEGSYSCGTGVGGSRSRGAGAGVSGGWIIWGNNVCKTIQYGIAVVSYVLPYDPTPWLT